MSVAKPKSNWIPLYLGPIHFRASRTEGGYGPGTEIAEMVRRNKADIAEIGVDEATCAVTIRWTALSGSTNRTVEHYYGFFPQSDLAPYKTTIVALDDIAHIQSDDPRVAAAYKRAAAVRAWLFDEFLNAIQAGLCRVHARRGAPDAPFHEIPSGMFRSYKIEDWGLDQDRWFIGSDGPLANASATSKSGEGPRLYEIYLEAKTIEAGSNLRAALKTDLDAAVAHHGRMPTVAELDAWRLKHAPSVSRDSLRDMRKACGGDTKRGPKGPRKNSRG